MNRILPVILMMTILSSCIVSKKKYDDLLAQKVSMEADLADKNARLDKATADLKDLDEKLKKLKDDTTDLGIDVRNTSQQLVSNHLYNVV